MKSIWQRVRKWVIHNIVGLDDTPHRIALGVLLGAMVTFTPLFGFHTLIYLGLVAATRANKLSGVPTLLITNLFTAAPIYYLCWKVGALLTAGAVVSDRVAVRSVDVTTVQELRYFAHVHWLSDPLAAQFWRDVWRIGGSLGAELWIGGLVVGLAIGVPLYFLTYWAVKELRHTRQEREQRKRAENMPG